MGKNKYKMFTPERLGLLSLAVALLILAIFACADRCQRPSSPSVPPPSSTGVPPSSSTGVAPVPAPSSPSVPPSSSTGVPPVKAKSQKSKAKTQKPNTPYHRDHLSEPAN